jgi:hypothetical protein
MDNLIHFDNILGGKIKSQRLQKNFSFESVSMALGIGIAILLISEQQPSRIPLNNLIKLLEFYDLKGQEVLELLNSCFDLK